MLAMLLIVLATHSQAQEPVGYIPQGKDLFKPYPSQMWAGAVIWTLGAVSCGYMYRTYPNDDRYNAGTMFLAGGLGGLVMMIGSQIPPLGRKGHHPPDADTPQHN